MLMTNKAFVVVAATAAGRLLTSMQMMRLLYLLTVPHCEHIDMPTPTVHMLLLLLPPPQAIC
jgi:hypothetical protein